MAYTYEKPVIASNIPVFVEETSEGSTGLLFESEDPSELAKAMMMACSWSREQKDAYKTKIRTLTEKKYNWSISAAKTAEAYEQVLSGLRRSEK
jgi:glycogen synthase